MPDRALPKRRLQILDDETRDGHRSGARRHQDMPAQEGRWVTALIARLAGMFRNIGGKP